MTSPLFEKLHCENVADTLHFVAPPHRDIVGIPFNPKVKPFTFASPLLKISMPAADFKRARTTFSWPSIETCECDQIGLIFIKPLPALPSPSIDKPGDPNSAPHYVKFGLEVIAGKPVIAVAGSNHMLDWSTWPTTDAHLEQLTIEFLRYKGGLLARIINVEDESRSANIRLLPWPLADGAEGDPDIWICLYVSRPDTDNTTVDSLPASFDYFEVEDEAGRVFKSTSEADQVSV